jgi:hypothetical protein
MNLENKMKRWSWICLTLLTVTLTGCFRQEVHTVDFTVPELTSQKEGDFLAPRIESLHGVAKAVPNLESNTLSVTYTNRYARMMNIEEAIALSGFDVNHRPANPTAKTNRIKLLNP